MCTNHFSKNSIAAHSDANTIVTASSPTKPEANCGIDVNTNTPAMSDDMAEMPVD